MSRRAALAIGVALAALACGGAGEEVEAPVEAPPTLPEPAPHFERAAHARRELAEALRNDAANPRHPSDGGGRAWLESSEPARAAGHGRWTILFEAGPHGVAVGGRILLQVSPFWHWSTPQTREPHAPGFTTVEALAEGVVLTAETLDQQLLGIAVGGRALAPGERIRIRYGAGEAGARADRYAERESRFFLAVDGDGDGVREWLPDPPATDVAAGPAARLLLHLPAVARPGEEIFATLAVLDAGANAGVEFAGEVVFGEHAESVRLPPSRVFDGSEGGVARVPLRVEAEGIVRLEARGPDGLAAVSNPMRVSAEAPRIRFGDLHGHSNLSDGTGTPEDYFAYARDVAGLDFVSLTDHDHWGIPFLDERPALRARIRRATEAAHAPGAFVTLHGYEWTSWIYGHRHVLYFDDGAGPWLSSLAPGSETPEQLWAALRGRPAMTLAHHSAGGPIASDWSIPPDPELEPLTEIVSVHGSSEAPDSPGPIYAPVRGNFVRDALGRGHRLGFVGSGDSHDGHPGLTHLAASSGGVAAVMSEELSREGLRRALFDRLSYATNGPRILLDVRLAGRTMGRVIPAAAVAGEARLVVDVVGTTEIDRVDVVRSGAVVASADAEGQGDLLLGYPVRALRPGEYLYVRVVQRDGGAAWSSPFFFD